MNRRAIEKITCITTDKDMYNGKLMYKALLEVAQESNLLQTTATKGLAIVDSTLSFCSNDAFQKQEQPILVQVLGTQEENEVFLKIITPIIQNRIVIKEQIEVMSLRSLE